MPTSLMDRLVQEQNELFRGMQDIQAEAEKAGEWSAVQREEWDKKNARIDVVSGDIDREERAAKLAAVDRSQHIDERSGTPAGGNERTQAERDAEADRAFERFVRHGMDGLTSEQRQLMTPVDTRAQGETIPAAGGYLVPPGYRTQMTESLKAFGGIMGFANVITTDTGNPVQWPTNDSTTQVGAILAENTQISELDVTIGTRAIGAYTYTSKLVRVSLQLLQDSAFDINTWLPGKLGERIGRAVADDLVNGLGIGEPTGLLPSTTAATLAATTSSAEWAANTSGKGYDAIIDLEHSIDPAYRNGNCRFYFNDNTLKQLRKFKDADGRPLWLPVPVPGMPATINGQPYTIDQAFPNQSTTAKFAIYGDLKAAYVVRQVLDVQMVRLAERYADFLQVGFFGFMRLDAVPDDPGAVRALAMSS